MGRHCTICHHPHRDDIDLALMLHEGTYRRIAARYGVAETSLRRHEHDHLGMSLKLSKGRDAMLSAEKLLDKLGEWHERMEQQYAKADAAGSVLGAVATARAAIADGLERSGAVRGMPPWRFERLNSRSIYERSCPRISAPCATPHTHHGQSHLLCEGKAGRSGET
jgi:hypothetical protein